MFWLITAVCRTTIRSHINNDKKCYPALAVILALKGTHVCPCPACLGARLFERAGAAPKMTGMVAVARPASTQGRQATAEPSYYHKNNSSSTAHRYLPQERQPATQHTNGKPLHNTRWASRYSAQDRLYLKDTSGKPLPNTRDASSCTTNERHPLHNTI